MREINYHILKQQIEHSNSDEKTENSISSALKKGKELIDTVSKSGNTELAQKFKKEYQELYNRIKRALEEETENEGKDTFSKLENLKIMIEL